MSGSAVQGECRVSRYMGMLDSTGSSLTSLLTNVVFAWVAKRERKL